MVKVIPQERISERTVEQIADVPVITEQLTRARRDSAGAVSAAHRGESRPVTAHSSPHPEGSECANGEVSEKSVAFSQAQADSDGAF